MRELRAFLAGAMLTAALMLVQRHLEDERRAVLLDLLLSDREHGDT
jgi:hypothetical protein